MQQLLSKNVYDQLKSASHCYLWLMADAPSTFYTQINNHCVITNLPWATHLGIFVLCWFFFYKIRSAWFFVALVKREVREMIYSLYSGHSFHIWKLAPFSVSRAAVQAAWREWSGWGFFLFLVVASLEWDSRWLEVNWVSLVVTAQGCHQKEIAGSAHAAFQITNWERDK